MRDAATDSDSILLSLCEKGVPLGAGLCGTSTAIGAILDEFPRFTPAAGVFEHRA
jgi:hypothetical protein